MSARVEQLLAQVQATHPWLVASPVVDEDVVHAIELARAEPENVERVCEVASAAANTPWVSDARQLLADAEALTWRDRRDGPYVQRLVALARAYADLGDGASAARMASRFEHEDRIAHRRSGGARLDARFVTFAEILLDVGNVAYAVKLVWLLCSLARERLDRGWAPGVEEARAARAFAVCGERDEAARIAGLIERRLDVRSREVIEELVATHLAIDRASSFAAAHAEAMRLADPYDRAPLLLALARYAHRIDDQGHVPLADAAPQPPPRAPLLDGEDLVPQPRGLR